MSPRELLVNLQSNLLVTSIVGYVLNRQNSRERTFTRGFNARAHTTQGWIEQVSRVILLFGCIVQSTINKYN